jgi:hypothetical protein
MAKLGSNEKSAIVHVETMDRAAEIMSLCNENNWQAIIDPKNLASRKILINNSFVSKEFKDIDGLASEILELNL